MKVECTWGDGPDVIVELDGTGLMLYEDPQYASPPRGQTVHGRVKQGSFDLTAAEAEDLGVELITAAKQARDMDKMAREHDEVREGMIEWVDIICPACRGGHIESECPYS